MPHPVHPNDALFAGERRFPVIPSCEHYAGSEKLILKAFELQAKNPVFDLTMDCEDGAPAGREREHAEMVVRLLTGEANRFRMAGVRIHDISHPAWKQDVDLIVPRAGAVLSYLTLPKPTCAADVAQMVSYIEEVSQRAGLQRELPIHVLIETHGALREVWEIAANPAVQVLDFGLMDFVSGHHGAIPAAAMKSPAQFEHALVRRAKSEIAAAALANGCVPSHNVTLDLKNAYQTHADAKRAKDELGYLRMWSIYPTQIQPIVDAMAPDYREVQRGAEILLAAQRNAWGPIQHAGDLHDRATYRYFWELLRRARLSGQKLPEEAERSFFG